MKIDAHHTILDFEDGMSGGTIGVEVTTISEDLCYYGEISSDDCFRLLIHLAAVLAARYGP